MEYKKTLLMPKTNFEMRGNLPKKDQFFLKFWDKKELYKNIAKKNKNYILHDGPPYANGNLHLGHILNKVLKDFIVKDKILSGYNVDFRPGWDTHGLPIEISVQKSGINLKEVGRENYLKSLYKYAYKQVELQEKQFKKFSIFADFNNKYLTLKNDFVYHEIKLFNEMLKKGLAYQDLKPIYWSWSSGTALAEAEIEYIQKEDNSIFVLFNLDNELNLLVWTTTPWTLPANVALAFGEKIHYIIVEIESKKFVIASELLEKLETKFNKKIKIISNFNTKNYIGKKAKNPLNNKESLIVYGHHVNTIDGTGIVHIAGGHGHDDYLIVKKNNLNLFNVLDKSGNMINTNIYDGIFYEEANELIIKDLKKNKNLFFYEKFTHSFPADWRTKKPVYYLATKQWFISIIKIKDEILNNIKDVEWNPSWGEKRLHEMIDKRDDWCISRQRIWGAPIPIIYDEKNQPIINEKLMLNIENFIKEKGVIGWNSLEIKDILPKEIKFNPKFTKEKDILDVWFDSGSSHYSVLKGKISDLYIEGTDQYRGWFNSSMITSTIIKSKSPYKKVITHGFVTDSNGNKMSKSLGNGVDPIELVEKNGLDIIRMWIASSDYHSNVKFSNEYLVQISSDYRKIRNSIKFILGNLNDFEGYYDFNKESISLNSKMILMSIEDTWKKIRNFYEENNYLQVLKILINDLTSGFISYFLDFSKDIVYVKSKNSKDRREVQFVLKEILNLILFSLAPIIPVTVEEAYHSFKGDSNNSIFELEYPKFNYGLKNNYWKEFSIIRNIVNKEIEELREKKIIKRTYEVEIELFLTKKISYFKEEELINFLQIGNIKIIKDSQNIYANAKLFKNSKKCERCWKIFKEEEINKNNICSSCDEVVKNFNKI